MKPGVKPGMPADVAVERLMEAHGGQLFALGLRLCGTREDAEDLVQDTLVSAWRNWPRFRGEAKPSTWLWTIAARACRRKRRKKSGEPAKLAPLSELTPFQERFVADTASVAADDGHAREAAREAVRAAILQLPAEFRLPLVMRDVLELPAAEVAHALGLEQATVRTRVHRARLRLREALLKALPKRPAPEPALERQVCVDLLHAKLDAQDRGRAFRMPRGMECDRCASVFAELDLAKDACSLLGEDAMPKDVRARLRASVGASKPPRRTTASPRPAPAGPRAR